MIEQDTIKLLRECDAGVQMGISSIDEVLDNIQNEELRQLLIDCKNEHIKLVHKIQVLLDRYHDTGKAPNPMAKGMSWIKTNVKLAVEDSDGTVADLMTDGCSMGVKSLSRYLNQYAAADEECKDIAKSLVRIEEQLMKDLRNYL
ncbi:MAG: hypothetical protein PUB99_10650 [Oscillospiraceae bacterium]|nr:hypothetical protein [Oscillospiraceae bacterium]